MSTSASSSVSFTSLAVLENGRVISGKKLVFDAQLYLPGASPTNSILAALHYYNNRGLSFPPVGKYIIHASVSSQSQFMLYCPKMTMLQPMTRWLQWKPMSMSTQQLSQRSIIS